MYCLGSVMLCSRHIYLGLTRTLSLEQYGCECLQDESQEGQGRPYSSRGRTPSSGCATQCPTRCRRGCGTTYESCEFTSCDILAFSPDHCLILRCQAQSRGTNAANPKRGQLSAKVEANKSVRPTPESKQDERLVVRASVTTPAKPSSPTDTVGLIYIIIRDWDRNVGLSRLFSCTHSFICVS